MNPHFERARVLLTQHRPEQAERELRLALTDEPDDPVIQALLALCLRDLRRNSAALKVARDSVANGPDLPFAHYAHACVLDAVDEFPAALDAVAEALRLDPEDADYYALRASLFLQMENPDAALRAADEGLAHDPTNADCINMRSRALLLTGRKSEAASAAQHALEQDPDNAYSHASAGWIKLQQGRYDEAATHFAEALQRQPGMEWARQGMLESLKARRILYRLMLRYYLWIEQAGSKMRWVVLIGIFLAVRFARGINPWLAVPLIAFVYLTWTAKPIFNLLLRFDKFGRLVLSPDERRATTFTAALLLPAAGLVITSAIRQDIALLIAGGVLAAMVVPIAATYETKWRLRRRIFGSYTIALFLTLLSAVGLGLAGLTETATSLVWVFAVSFIAFLWIAQFDFGKDQPVE